MGNPPENHIDWNLEEFNLPKKTGVQLLCYHSESSDMARRQPIVLRAKLI